MSGRRAGPMLMVARLLVAAAALALAAWPGGAAANKTHVATEEELVLALGNADVGVIVVQAATLSWTLPQRVQVSRPVVIRAPANNSGYPTLVFGQPRVLEVLWKATVTFERLELVGGWRLGGGACGGRGGPSTHGVGALSQRRQRQPVPVQRSAVSSAWACLVCGLLRTLEGSCRGRARRRRRAAPRCPAR